MSKITKTILDPAYEVGRMEISSEHDKPIYFDKSGKRIPFIDVEQDYKPEYDFETSNIEHWYYRTRSELFRDVHVKVATFRARNTVEKYAKAIVILWFDKHILRFL